VVTEKYAVKIAKYAHSGTMVQMKMTTDAINLSNKPIPYDSYIKINGE
jgi:hypothetical protein